MKTFWTKFKNWNLPTKLGLILGLLGLLFSGGLLFNYTYSKFNINNVNGDIIISNNQTGGLTAHTIIINNPSPIAELIYEEPIEQGKALRLIIGNKNGQAINNLKGLINFDSTVDTVQLATVGDGMVVNRSQGNLSNDHSNYSFTAQLLPLNYLEITIRPFVKGTMTWQN